MMNITEQIVYDWLISKGYKIDEIIYNKYNSPDFITTRDNKRWECKKLYNKTIVIYDRQAEKLYEKPDDTYIVLVDVENRSVVDVINVADLERYHEYYRGYKISWITKESKISKLKESNIVFDDDLLIIGKDKYIRINDDVLQRLQKYGKDYSEIIEILLNKTEYEIGVSVSGVTNEMLPVILAFITAKSNKLEYYDALHKLMNGDTNISDYVLRDFIKYKIIYKDEFKNKIKLLSWFEHSIVDGKIRISVAYNTEFCRMFCSNMFNCTKYRSVAMSGKNKWFGNVYVFDIEDFDKSSIQELIGICVMECVEK